MSTDDLPLTEKALDGLCEAGAPLCPQDWGWLIAQARAAIRLWAERDRWKFESVEATDHCPHDEGEWICCTACVRALLNARDKADAERDAALANVAALTRARIDSQAREDAALAQVKLLREALFKLDYVIASDPDMSGVLRNVHFRGSGQDRSNAVQAMRVALAAVEPAKKEE